MVETLDCASSANESSSAFASSPDSVSGAPICCRSSTSSFVACSASSSFCEMTSFEIPPLKSVPIVVSESFQSERAPQNSLAHFAWGDSSLPPQPAANATATRTTIERTMRRTIAQR
jgi:hypothetical protein